MSDADKLIELIDQYWDIAWREGSDGRSHDTEEGSAQECRHEIGVTITRLKSEVERLRGRCGELECAAKNAAKSIIRTVNSTPKTILIKQAEAVEAFANHISEMADDDADDWWSVSKTPLEQINDAREYAQRLRQQAAESEQ